MPDTTDDALIAAARRGDLDAFNALVLRYQDRAYTLAYRLLGDAAAAADAAQESLIIAYRRLATFRGGSFQGWLQRIVANRCYDVLRRGKRRPSVSLDDDPDDAPIAAERIADDAPSPESAVEARELHRAIQHCIDALSPDQRIVLVLADIEGLAYQAIADTTGAQVGTVKSRLSRSRAAMRDCLRGLGELLPSAYRLTQGDAE